jgi:hypothetical protein
VYVRDVVNGAAVWEVQSYAAGVLVFRVPRNVAMRSAGPRRGREFQVLALANFIIHIEPVP